MTRIYLSLAATALLFMAATMVMGLMLGDVRDVQDEWTQQWVKVHFLSGLLTALGIMFVHSLAVTYFVGTTRWCKEVVETYKLPAEYVARSARLKRRTFALATASMLGVVVIAALGAASDPAANVRWTPIAGVRWSDMHLAASLSIFAFLLFASTSEWNHIHSQGRLIAEIMADVRRIRLERGLDVEEPALR